MIPKTRGVRKSLFRVIAPKETEYMSFAHWTSDSLLFFFFSRFRLLPGCRKGLENKTYPAMNSPVHGESDVGYDCLIKCLFLFSVLSLYISIFLLLPLCNAVSLKVQSLQSCHQGATYHVNQDTMAHSTWDTVLCSD